MIPNQWYVILESNEVKSGKPIGLTRFGEPLVAWRDSRGAVSVMRDRCPHRGVALSVGDIRGDCLECPFHGFQFDTSGRCTLIPANGQNAEPPKAMHVSTFPAQEAHGFIYAWYGEPQIEYPPLPFFDVIDDSFSYKTVKDHWATHYSRAIENQLDVVHLPFIHRTTIGRGHKTIVNGPLSRLIACPGESDILDVWVSNEVDTRPNAEAGQRTARAHAACLSPIPFSQHLAQLDQRRYAHRRGLRSHRRRQHPDVSALLSAHCESADLAASVQLPRARWATSSSSGRTSAW